MFELNVENHCNGTQGWLARASPRLYHDSRKLSTESGKSKTREMGSRQEG